MRRPKKRPTRLLSRLRPSQLELLAAMERTDTLSAAAREVNLTQPAASRLLRTLASDLNISLFERVGRTLKPTTAGRTLVRRAAALVADIDRTQQELEAIDGGLIGTASIGTGVSSCYVIVPRALTLLLGEAPRITVTVREGPMDELLTRLRSGQIDLLLGRFTGTIQNSDITAQELYRPAVRAVCGPDHPLGRKRSVSWNDLIDQPWILPENGTAMRSAVETLFRKQRRRPERCLVEIIVDPDQCRTGERIGSDLGAVRRRGGLFRQSRRAANAQRSGIAGARKLRGGASSRSKPLAGGAASVRLSGEGRRQQAIVPPDNGMSARSVAGG